MFEPFSMASSRCEKKHQFSLPSWVGWELVVVIILLCATWWFCGGTVVAFFGGSWDPSQWTLV